MIGNIREGGIHPEVKFGVSSCKIAVFRNVVAQSYTSKLFCCWLYKCLYSVPATEQQKRQWLCLIFNDNMPAAVRVSFYVCANHFTLDCFSNEGQYKAGFASTLTLLKGSVPTMPDPATAPEPQVIVTTFW